MKSMENSANTTEKQTVLVSYDLGSKARRRGLFSIFGSNYFMTHDPRTQAAIWISKQNLGKQTDLSISLACGVIVECRGKPECRHFIPFL